MDGADHFLRAAIANLLGSTKSATISMALLHGAVSLDQALEAASVEEDYQIEENGFVEDGHDTQKVQTRVKAAAAAAFLRLVPSSAPSSAPEAMALDAMRARTRSRRLFDAAAADERREKAAEELRELVRSRGWDDLPPEEQQNKILEEQLRSMTQSQMLPSFEGSEGGGGEGRR